MILMIQSKYQRLQEKPHLAYISEKDLALHYVPG